MKTNQMLKIAIFPALMVATLGISIPITGAPITLQTLFVILSGLFLGKRDGAISMVIYLLLGVIGLPVFSNFQGGLGVLAGPTGGFLLSFPIAAYVTGWLTELTNKAWIGVVTSTLLIYVIGVPWMSYMLGYPLVTTLGFMWVYLPGDGIKAVAAIILYKRKLDTSL